MRIVVVNTTTSRMGGVEKYLSVVIPALIKQGHELSILTERQASAGREPISPPGELPAWCVETIGADRAAQELLKWKPDLLFSHKFDDPVWESRLQRLGTSIFFAHDYNGLCISGDKTHKFPIVKPCTRRFGAACLMQYFPYRCGGRSPLTMLSLFATQKKRLKLLKRYDSVITTTRRMVSELRLHRITARCIRSYPVSHDPRNVAQQRARDGVYRLVFSGRMEFLKGAHVLLEAAPIIVSLLGRPLQIMMVGEGRERSQLERLAGGLRDVHRLIDVVFTGWLNTQQQIELYAKTDLMLMPSLWPEPFGMAGLEAGLQGVPSVAFAVGGIPDWLHEGVNGALAPGDPPTAAGLAGAVYRCLADPVIYDRLRKGALLMARDFNMNDHMSSLSRILNQTLGDKFDSQRKGSVSPARMTRQEPAPELFEKDATATPPRSLLGG